jgi:hypothetical protein
MAESIDNSILSENHDLQYISDVVNQVLAQGNGLASVKDFQSALKEISAARGREVQMNLVTDQNQIVGFNFSFKDTPNKCTTTIPFKHHQQEEEQVNELIITHPNKWISTIPLKQQQQKEEQVDGSIVTHQKQQKTIDVVATGVKGDIVHSSSEELDQTLPLTPIFPLSIDSSENLNSSTSGLPMNLDLAKAVQQLASSNELNGLWITGTALKPVAAAAKFLETEVKPDIHAAGQAVIKRFEQVLPQQFEELKTGGSPKPFNWKDFHSGKLYLFEFEVATSSPEGKPITPATLRGFEESGNELKPVFSAQLVDPKSNHWSIEQCDFTQVQLRSLSVADKPSRLKLDTNTLPKKTHASAFDLLEL